MAPSVSRRADDGRLVVVTIGAHLGAADRDALKRMVAAELDRGARAVHLDFAKSAVVDSAGLGALVAVARAVRERGAELALLNVDQDLAALLRLTKVDQVLGYPPRPA